MIRPTSWTRVILGVVLYFFLSLVLAGALTFETYSVNFFTQSLGFLAAVWIAWKVARERVLWAVIPTVGFWLLALAITIPSVTSGSLHLRSWLTILGVIITCLAYAWWLGRRSRLSGGPLADG